MYFDRFDIVEAYAVYYWHYHMGGLTKRDLSKSNRSIATQLHTMQFKARPSLEVSTLTENGREIYDNLVAKYG